MTSRLARTGRVVCLLLLAGSAQAGENPYEDIYQRSLERMSSPDVLGEAIADLTAPQLNKTILLAAGTSRTCSQRCSTRCSVSCTTTRGCSTLCKKQTEGCGGWNPPVEPPPDPKPPAKIPAEEPSSETQPPRSTRQSFTGQVAEVLEGDLISVVKADTTRVKVKLGQIDAPEMGQASGDEARKALANKVLGKQVTVLPLSAEDQAVPTASVYLGTRWINKEMLDEGLAWYLKDPLPSALLAQSEETARKAKAGLWAGKEPVPPWDFRRAAAARDNAANQAIQAGDLVKVIDGPAPVKVGTETLTVVDSDTVLTAQKCQAEWVKVTVEKEGKKIVGWIHTKRLVRLAGSPGKQPDGQKAPTE